MGVQLGLCLGEVLWALRSWPPSGPLAATPPDSPSLGHEVLLLRTMDSEQLLQTFAFLQTFTNEIYSNLFLLHVRGDVSCFKKFFSFPPPQTSSSAPTFPPSCRPRGKVSGQLSSQESLTFNLLIPFERQLHQQTLICFSCFFFLSLWSTLPIQVPITSHVD